MSTIPAATPVNVTATISFRRFTLLAAAIGIASKLVLFLVITRTNHWTVGTQTLTWATIVSGLMTIGLALVGLLGSGSDWMYFVAFVLGLITAAPVLGYSA